MHEIGSARELSTDEEIGALLTSTRSIAVLGIKTEAQAEQPAFYVAKYAQDAGYRVLPVPVYYPEVTTILGQPVTRTVSAIGEPVDLAPVAHEQGRGVAKNDAKAKKLFTKGCDKGNGEEAACKKFGVTYNG